MSVALAVLLHALAQVQAADAPPDPSSRSTFEISWENDALVGLLIGGSDHNYTQGVRAMHLWGVPSEHFAWLDWGQRKRNHRVDLGVVIPGQLLYTPDSIILDRIDDIQGQRPYAGYLYMGTVLRSVSWPWRVALELDIGTTGPASLAQEIQTWFHVQVCHCADQPSWVGQIGNEFQVQLLGHVERAVLPIPAFWTTGEMGQLSVIGEVRAGTLFASAGGGAEVRLGQLGPYLDITNISSAPAPGKHWEGWPAAWFFYGRTHLRAVLRNGTLQGRLFAADPYTVGAVPLVLDNELGGVLRGGDVFAVRLSFVFRSTEMRGRAWNPFDHTFGVFHLVVGRLDASALQ